MPIDNDLPDTFKLGSELEVGDVIRHQKSKHGTGIISRVDKEGKSKFWEGRPNYSYYDVNCSSHGSGSTQLDLNEKFQIVNGRKDILRIYKDIDYDLLSMAADILEWRKELVQVKNIMIDRLNKKLTEMKKQNMAT